MFVYLADNRSLVGHRSLLFSRTRSLTGKKQLRLEVGPVTIFLADEKAKEIRRVEVKDLERNL